MKKRLLKFDKEDIDMCKAIDDIRKYGREEGLLEVYHNMINDNIPEEQARKLSGVTDEILENEMKAE